MKRFQVRSLRPVAVSLFCLLFFGMIERMTAQGANLLLNGSFEEAGDEGIEHWEFSADTSKSASSGGKATIGSVEQDSENTKTGGVSLRMTNKGPRWVWVRQAVEFEPLATYKLTVWARTALKEKPDLKISIGAHAGSAGEKDDQGNPVRPLMHRETIALDPNGEWQEVSTTFTAPDKVEDKDSEINIELRCIPRVPDGEPVEVWFDDVTLEKVDS